MNLFSHWGPPFMAWGGQKWPCFDYKWPNMAGLSTLQIGPKGSKWLKMSNIPLIDHLRPFWVLFKQKLICCTENPKCSLVILTLTT